MEASAARFCNTSEQAAVSVTMPGGFKMLNKLSPLTAISRWFRGAVSAAISGTPSSVSAALSHWAKPAALRTRATATTCSSPLV